jgi:hypothetical protein
MTKVQGLTSAVSSGQQISMGRLHMPKKVIWLIILFTLLFVLGVNTGDLDYLLNLGNTI